MKAPQKSQLLSSTAAREALAGKSEQAFLSVINTIESLSGRYDALETLYTTPDPSRTLESHALQYRETHQKAAERAAAEVAAVLESLKALENRYIDEAEKKAGLHNQLPTHIAAELRAALRGMTQKERDKAITEAIKNGDVAVIQAVRESPNHLLTGKVSIPHDAIYGEFVRRADPEIESKIEDVNSARNHLNFAYEAFSRDANKMRDPLLEAKADQQKEQTDNAKKLLD